MEMEMKEEPMDHQGSSSHLPSSSGVDGVRNPDGDGYLIIDPSDDLKKEVKEEPFEDHSHAELPTSSTQQTSGTGYLRFHPGYIKEEDVCVKDEPIEEMDPLAVSTTTFTPKPESTWTEELAQQHEGHAHTEKGSMSPLPVTTAVLPQEPAADQDDIGSDTHKAGEHEAIALQKKWKNIRDCYRRECAKKKTEKSGSGATAVRKEYIFFSQLSFLSANNDLKPLSPLMTWRKRKTLKKEDRMPEKIC